VLCAICINAQIGVNVGVHLGPPPSRLFRSNDFSFKHFNCNVLILVINQICPLSLIIVKRAQTSHKLYAALDKAWG